MSSEIFPRLKANGYWPGAISIEGVNHDQILGAEHSCFFASSEDFHANRLTWMRDANASLAVLQFDVGEASPLQAKFTDELVKLLAPADRLLNRYQRPLVRREPTLTQCVYQTDTPHVAMTVASGHRPLFEHGFTFKDVPNRFSRPGRLYAHCGDVLLDGARWLNEATPLTVKRADLPVFDREATAAQLRALVDRFIATGELREYEPYREPARPSALTYGDGSTFNDDLPTRVEYADERLRRAFAPIEEVDINNSPEARIRRRERG